MRERPRAWAALLLVAALGLIAVGCGGDDGANGGGDGSQAEGPANVSVGVLPIAPLAPVYVGTDSGIFEEHDLSVEPSVQPGGTAAVSAVVSGELDFGYSNLTSVITAVEEGLPLQVVAADGARPASGTVVNSSSDFTSMSDLEGATIAVNAVGTIGELVVRADLEEQGVDLSTVDFVEVGFADMLAALEGDRVDAVWAVEPFRSQADESGDFRVLGDPVDVLKDGEGVPTIAVFFAREDFVSDNPSVVERFRAAITETYDYSNEHLDEVVAAIPTFTEIPPEEAENVPLGNPYQVAIDMESVERTGELMVRYDQIEEMPDFESMIVRSP